MIHHPEREKIFGFVHQMLEPADAAEVHHHLDECDECRRMAEGFQKLDTVLTEWKSVEPSAWFDARLRQAIAQPGAISAWRMFWSFPATRALATAIVAVFVIGGSLMIYRFRQAEKAREVTHVALTRPTPTAEPAPVVPETATEQALAAEEELKMYENLPVLENYDLLTNFDVLSELPQAKKAESANN